MLVNDRVMYVLNLLGLAETLGVASEQTAWPPRLIRLMRVGDRGTGHLQSTCAAAERNPILRRHVTLSATPDAPSIARRALRAAIPPPALLDRDPDAQLVLSEIVSNAVTYGSGPADMIGMLIDADEVMLRVQVDQAGPVSGVHLVDPHFLALTGRGQGLQIIEALADSWGTSEPDSNVWFEFRA